MAGNISVEAFDYTITTMTAVFNSSITPSARMRSSFISQVGAAIDWIHLIMTPLILLVGLPGNSIAIIVFLEKSMRKMASSVLLSAMAFWQLMYLMTVLPMWLWKVGLPTLKPPYICHILMYLHTATATIAVWSLVIFVAEQYITVCHPLVAPKLCTPHRGIVASLVLSLSFLAFYSYYPIYTSTLMIGQDALCHIDGRSLTFNVLELTHVALSVIIPYSCIMILSLCIMRVVRRIQKIRREQKSKKGKSVSGRSAGRGQREMHIRLQIKITRLLLAMSAFFFLSTFPCAVYHCLLLIELASGRDLHPAQGFTASMLKLLYFFNYVTNFYLYITFAKKFRESLFSLFCGPCIRRRKDRLRRRNIELMNKTVSPDDEAHHQLVPSTSLFSSVEGLNKK